jgi:uncharacterized protein YbjT (DUF2867 family)
VSRFCDTPFARARTNATTVAMLCAALGGPPDSVIVHGREAFDAPITLALGGLVQPGISGWLTPPGSVEAVARAKAEALAAPVETSHEYQAPEPQRAGQIPDGEAWRIDEPPSLPTISENLSDPLILRGKDGSFGN